MSKMKSKICTVGTLFTFVVLSACTAAGNHQPSLKGYSNQTAEYVSDGRMSDLSAIEYDADLYIGDLGVERVVSPHSVRNLEGGEEQALLPQQFPLKPVFPDTSIAPIDGSYVENVIATAMTYLGKPYMYGSDRTDPSTFDCSDLTHWAYLHALGMDLPLDSRNQAAYVEAFSKRKYHDLSQARRGDLLFFTSFRGGHPSDYEGLSPSEMQIAHVGIYLGNGKIIHAASKKTRGVRIDSIKGTHLEHRFVLGGGILD